jgi:hypothetical protein
MLDSGASHNLMPKFIMEKLGLMLQNLIRIYILLIQRNFNVLG